jgi:hypothetical protein
MGVQVRAADGHPVGGDKVIDESMREYVDANGGWIEDDEGNVLYGERSE